MMLGATQAGLEAYVGAVAAASALPIIVYHRANARFEPETFARLLRTQPNVVGFKDGIGDIALTFVRVMAAGIVLTLLYTGVTLGAASAASSSRTTR